MFDQELPEWSQELENHWLRSLPLFVSIPRSGCNWLQAVMELYFNRHRAGKGVTNPSWLETKFENPMWMHTHDNFNNATQGKIETDNPAIFLWREPVDTIYSFMKLQKLPMESKSTIYALCVRIAALYKKWAIKNENVLVIKYDDVVANPSKEMKKISEWYGVKFDENKCNEAFKTVGDKKNTNEKNGPAPHFKNKASGTIEYKNEREMFRDKWKEGVDRVFAEAVEKL